MPNPCSRLRDICPHLLWFLRLNKLDGWMNVNKESGHVENKDEVELKSSCELFVPSPRILLSEFKPYRSACLTFFPLDLHRLCLCVECEGLKDNFVNISVPIAHTALWEEHILWYFLMALLYQRFSSNISSAGQRESGKTPHQSDSHRVLPESHISKVALIVQLLPNGNFISNCIVI